MKLKFIYIACLLFSALLIVGCRTSVVQSEDNEDIGIPFLSEDGAFCFSSEEASSVRYLQIKLRGTAMEGSILAYDEAWGDIIYFCSGKKINDSLYKISVHNLPEDFEQEWQLSREGGKLKISGISRDGEQLTFTPIKCADFPETEHYMTVENIDSEMEGGAYENALTFCFYKYYPTGSNRRVTVAEYLRMKDLDGRIDGIGAGYSEGDPDWRVAFSGDLISDSTYQVAATYTTTDNEIYRTEEVWTVNFEKGSLRVLKIAANKWRQVGAPFHVIDCAGIDEWALKLMYPEHP